MSSSDENVKDEALCQNEMRTCTVLHLRAYIRHGASRPFLTSGRPAARSGTLWSMDQESIATTCPLWQHVYATCPLQEKMAICERGCLWTMALIPSQHRLPLCCNQEG